MANETQMLHALMNSSQDVVYAIYFKDRASRFIRYSAGIAALFKLAHADDAIGKTDFDFQGREHAQQAFDDEQSIMSTGRPLIGKSEKETWPDGRITWALTSKMPLHDETGAIIGTFGVSQDITAIKEAEAKIEELHQLLLNASRQAGMAEVATSSLHNVGNVLTSVNVSASLIVESAKKSRIPNLSKAAALLNDHASDLGGFLTDDPKGKLPARLSFIARRGIDRGAGKNRDRASGYRQEH